MYLNNVSTNLPPVNGFSCFSSKYHIEGVSELSTSLQDPNNGTFLADQNQDDINVKQTGKEGSSCAYWVKGQWTSEEDRKLVKLVKEYGLRKWAVIAEQMVGRIGKQCRERWQNHLRPDIKKSLVWSDEEEKLIIEAHEKFGNRWAEIAKCVPGRSENAIKNHWNATKRKQTSKRKIRRPERLRGIIQSTVLEEYIKKKYFIKVLSTSNQPKTDDNPHEINDIYDADSMTYFTLETFDEEMDFMKNLFTNKDNPSQIINDASNYI